MSRMRRLPLLAIGMVLAGCSITVQGAPVRARPGAITDVRIHSVAQALPDVNELSGVLGSRMMIGFPAQVGGLDALPSDKGDSSLQECVKVTSTHARLTFRDAPLRAAAIGLWQTAGSITTAPYFNVNIGVVELDLSESAQAWFAKFGPQWQQCQGKTVVEYGDDRATVKYTDEVTRVVDSDGILTAVVLLSSADGNMKALPVQRAFTVASRYLVDVRVSDTSWGAGDPINADKAVAVARLVTSKIISTS